MHKGKFIISLDLELMWGVRDKETKISYGKNIIGGRKNLNEMLLSFDKYNIKATFATVGFLFHKSKKDFLNNIPKKIPSYLNKKLSPYYNLEKYIGKNENDDPYYYGRSLIELINKYDSHEISTHTYCHYYCLEEGQTIEEFEEDLLKTIQIAKKNNIKLKSIVFPRNQYDIKYLDICKKNGIESYRGSEASYIYKSSNDSKQNIIKRALRLLDSYINLTGYNCYNLNKVKNTLPFNFPSSRFLRPYNKKLKYFEKLKFLRIKNAMTYAAKNKLLYHLWWHPHNFGKHLNENIILLENILKHYNYLNNKYDFQSLTMSDLSNELKIK